MDNPRPEKTAIVTEVRERLDAADAAILTEYRGLTVAELAALRTALRSVGCDYKIYKNTLVRRAVAGNEHEELAALLSGPTAITFVTGEVSAAAKALRDFARTYPSLVVKGGLHPEGFLSTQDLQALADLPSRDVLLARVAGAIAAPLQQMAGLIEALPRNMAYGLSALLDKQGGAPAEAAEPATAEAEAPESATAPVDDAAEAPPADIATEPAAADTTAETTADTGTEPVAETAGEPVAEAETEAAADSTAESGDDTP